MPKKEHAKLGIDSIIESWVDSNQASESVFGSWGDLNLNSGSFLSHESIWIKFQKSVLSRDLIWIKSCKAIVGHGFSRIKAFLDWVESNITTESYPCLSSTPENYHAQLLSRVSNSTQLRLKWVESKSIPYVQQIESSRNRSPKKYILVGVEIHYPVSLSKHPFSAIRTESISSTEYGFSRAQIKLF